MKQQIEYKRGRNGNEIRFFAHPIGIEHVGLRLLQL